MQTESNDSHSLGPYLWAYAVGFVVLGYTLYQYRFARRARGWPTAAGTILSRATDIDDGHTSIELSYEYRVAGSVYQGKRFRFGGGPYVRQKTVDAILQRYPVGASVCVHYNPEAPRDCVLDTAFEWVGHLPSIILAVLAFVPTTYHLFVDGPFARHP